MIGDSNLRCYKGWHGFQFHQGLNESWGAPGQTVIRHNPRDLLDYPLAITTGQHGCFQALIFVIEGDGWRRHAAELVHSSYR